ncbi:MAG TPA: VanW family protein [Propionibacteriaceae bacterium]
MTAQTPRWDVGPDETIEEPAQPADEQPTDERPAGPQINWLLVAAIVGGVLAIALILYVAGYLVAGDKLPKKAQVSGVAVGGLHPSEAIDKLTAELGGRAAEPVNLTVKDNRAQLKPADAGLAVDYAESVEAAGGGKSLNPLRIVRVLTGGSAIEAVVVVDEPKLGAAVGGLSKTFNHPPVDAAVAYRGTKIKQKPAREGTTLQQDSAATMIKGSFLKTTGPLELPADVAPPAVTDQEADQLIADFARPAIAGPVKVGVKGDRSFEVTPKMLAASIEFLPQNGTLVPALDAKKLRRNAQPAIKRVELVEPRNATVRLVKGKPKVIPAVDGTTVVADDLKKAIEPVLTKPAAERTVSVQLTGAKAAFSTADAKKLGIKQVTGQFTTYFPYLPYRNINIGRAAALINGTLLKPGDVFSLNQIVGERTKANGFTEGFIIKDGRFRKELGGGVSQSATTTFNAMFFAGLKDVFHKPHGLFIDRYPAGREATVAWPSLDLKFQNDTKYGVLVQAYIVKGTPSRKGSITVKMWSTKTYDKIVATQPIKSNFKPGRDVTDDSKKCEPSSPVQGFDVRYQRLFYKNGSVVRRENFSWRYAPTDKVTCEKPKTG